MQVFQTLQIWDGYNMFLFSPKKSEGKTPGFPFQPMGFEIRNPEELSNGRLAMMSIFVTFLLVPRKR